MTFLIKLYNDIIEEYRTEFPNRTPLVCACEEGRVEDVEDIIRGARAAGMDVAAMVNEVGTDLRGYSCTPLIAAAEKEHSTIIEILLRFNADTNITNNEEGNALHYAAYHNETTTTTVQLLLNNMKLEDINHKDTHGDTPLDFCYEYNHSSQFYQTTTNRLDSSKRRKKRERIIKYPIYSHYLHNVLITYSQYK